MLKTLNLQNVLFLDIETVPAAADFSELSEEWQQLWADKTKFQRERDEKTAEEFYPERAGILAEFGKVVCISCGLFARYGQQTREFRVKSYFGEDEKVLLQEFADLLNKNFGEQHHLLCAHNGKEFDFPYLSRRMLINGIDLPRALNTAGKKPWEIQHIDTLELWKFGDYKHYTSLKLLCALFNIPTPKDDMDGSMVGPVFWQEKDVARIARYCEKDAVTVAQLVLAYRGENILKEAEVVSAT